MESLRNPRQSLTHAASLDELREGLGPLAFMAGWNKLEPSLWREPRTAFQAAKWCWADAKEGLDAAGRLISAEQADRRNLFMVNPIEGNYYPTVRTLVCAYQMILPGERARSHRHSPNALRLVLDVGDATYTVVDGERLEMAPGDVVLTPGWCWHGHANDGSRPGYWIDFLDVPLVQLLEPMFLEGWPEGFQMPTASRTQSPYVFSRGSIEQRLDTAEPDPSGRHGARIELTGTAGLSTIALHMERLRTGDSTVPFRTTANQIFAVAHGSGATSVDGRRFHWRKGDVVAVPSWQRFSHDAEEDSLLFCVSDRAAMQALGFLRTGD